MTIPRAQITVLKYKPVGDPKEISVSWESGLQNVQVWCRECVRGEGNVSNQIARKSSKWPGSCQKDSGANQKCYPWGTGGVATPPTHLLQRNYVILPAPENTALASALTKAALGRGNGHTEDPSFVEMQPRAGAWPSCLTWGQFGGVAWKIS